MTRAEDASKSAPPDPTWADIKQLGWAVLLVLPFIAVVSFAARGFVGARTALWMGLGLAGLVVFVFALIVGLSLAASYGHEYALKRRSRRRGWAKQRQRTADSYQTGPDGSERNREAR